MRSGLRVLAVALGIVLAGSAGVRCGEPGVREKTVISLSLREAVVRALRTAERIKAARAGVQRAAAGVGQARASALPQISADAGFTRSKRELTAADRALGELAESFGGMMGVSGAESGGDEFTPRRYEKLYSAGIGVRQTLFGGGRTINGLRVARASRRAAGAQLEAARLSTAAAAVRSYYVALFAEEVRKVRLSTYRLAQKHHQQMLIRLKAKAASRFDVLRSKVAMQNQEAQMIDADLLMRQARVSLLRAIGAPQGAEVELTSRFRKPASLPELSAGLRKAARLRPDLVEARHALEAGRHSVKLAKSGYYPTLQAVARWGGQSDDDPFEDDNFDESGLIGLELHWNLFDGLMTRSRVAAARAEFEQLNWLRRGLERDVEMEVRRALLAVRSARKFIAAQGANVKEATEALRLAEVRQKAGAATELDVRDARNQLEQARLNYARSLYQHAMAVLDFRVATGDGGEFGTPAPPTKKSAGGAR